LPDTSIIINESVVLTITGGDTTFSYIWSPPDGLDCATCPQPSASPTGTTTYLVNVTDTNGCVASDFVTITVLIPDLFIPTGFSPNGDGINDVVFVRSLDIKTMVFQIFDRWGGLVFETTNQKNGCDGTYKGKKLDFGVYVYKFEATLLSGKKITKSGSITLFK